MQCGLPAGRRLAETGQPDAILRAHASWQNTTAAASADPRYLQARQAINRGNYNRRRLTFWRRWPGSSPAIPSYATEALYWQAFALYRMGTPTQMKQAVEYSRTSACADRTHAEKSIAELRKQEQDARHIYEEQARQSRKSAEQQGQDTKAQYEQQRNSSANRSKRRWPGSASRCRRHSSSSAAAAMRELEQLQERHRAFTERSWSANGRTA